jgi:hypothetical protein
MLRSANLARPSARTRHNCGGAHRVRHTAVGWCQRRRRPPVSSRERRMLVRWLRRTANHRFDQHPLARRRETLLEDRVAAVSGDLLEIAALLERTRNPNPACVAALRDLLASGHNSPLYNESLHPSELRASLYYSRLMASPDVATGLTQSRGASRRPISMVHWLIAVGVLVVLAGPARADAASLVYLDQASNVWIASPDGAIKRQLTGDASPDSLYLSPSMQDDGTVVVPNQDGFTRVLNADGTNKWRPWSKPTPSLFNTALNWADAAATDSFYLAAQYTASFGGGTDPTVSLAALNAPGTGSCIRRPRFSGPRAPEYARRRRAPLHQRLTTLDIRASTSHEQPQAAVAERHYLEQMSLTRDPNHA